MIERLDYLPPPRRSSEYISARMRLVHTLQEEAKMYPEDVPLFKQSQVSTDPERLTDTERWVMETDALEDF